MKEPWKKSCNGKVIITLNNENNENEKATPTEVEVPVDFNFSHPHQHCAYQERKPSSSKTVVLVGVILVLGLTLVTLFKVQNLVYSTNYLTWRMQNLESAVGDSNDDVKLIKYKLSLEEDELDAPQPRLPQPQPLLGAKDLQPQQQQIGSDLKLSESQNQNHKLNSNSLLNGQGKKANEAVDEGKKKQKKEEEEEAESDKSREEQEQDEAKETDDLNDARDHPNPADPEDLIKPMIDIFRNPGASFEDHFVQDVLKFLNDVPKENVEIIELNKMQDNGAGSSAENSEQDLADPMKRKIVKPLIVPIDAFFRKASPVSLGAGNLMFPKMRFFPLPIRQQQQQQESQQQQQSQQSLEEIDNPKIMIHSIKLKLRPMVPQDEPNVVRGMEAPAPHPSGNSFEIFRVNPMNGLPMQEPEPQPQPPQPKHQHQPMAPPPMSEPLFNQFFPIQDILNSVIKHVEEGEAGNQPRFEPVPFHIKEQVVPKLLVPPMPQQVDEYAQRAAQEQPQPQQQQPSIHEINRMPVHTMEVPSPYHQHHMINPMATYGRVHEPMSEEMPPQVQPVQSQEQPQQQEQQQPQQTEEAQPKEEVQEPQQQQQQQQQQTQTEEEPRAMPRSTKLNPVESAWNMPTQYPTVPVQN